MFCVIFFFKQKTAYEMRISDWSSDGALPIYGRHDRQRAPFRDADAGDQRGRQERRAGQRPAVDELAIFYARAAHAPAAPGVYTMMRSLWIAKTGLEGQQTSMDVISNNLANVQTNGFKRGRAIFQDLMYQTLRQPGAQVGDANQLPTGLQLGPGVRVASTERVVTEGNLTNTGRR